MLAFFAVAGATALMWWDGAVALWQEIIAVAFRTNESVTSRVMGVRQWGDADLHVMVWGAVAVCVFFALTTSRGRLFAIMALLIWSVFVEIAQPWFTAVRSRQWVDLAGNFIGILGVFVVLTLITRPWKQGRHHSPVNRNSNFGDVSR